MCGRFVILFLPFAPLVTALNSFLIASLPSSTPPSLFATFLSCCFLLFLNLWLFHLVYIFFSCSVCFFFHSFTVSLTSSPATYFSLLLSLLFLLVFFFSSHVFFIYFCLFHYFPFSLLPTTFHSLYSLFLISRPSFYLLFLYIPLLHSLVPPLISSHVIILFFPSSLSLHISIYPLPVTFTFSILSFVHSTGSSSCYSTHFLSRFVLPLLFSLFPSLHSFILFLPASTFPLYNLHHLYHHRCLILLSPSFFLFLFSSSLLHCLRTEGGGTKR